MDVPPTTPPPYTLLTASGPTCPGTEAPKAAGGSGSQQPQETAAPCPCPCHVDTPYPHHQLARLRAEQVIQQTEGQWNQAQTQRELAPQAHNQQLREQAQQPQDVYQTPLSKQGLSEDRGYPPAGPPSSAPAAGAATTAATGAAGATTTTAGAATTNTGAPATNSSSSSTTAAAPDSSGAAPAGVVVGSGAKGSEGVAGAGGFVPPEASPVHPTQGSQRHPPQHNTMQDSIHVGSGAGAVAGTGGGTKATEGFGSPMLSPGSPAEKAAPAAPAPAATAHAHPATDALTTNTTAPVIPSPLGTASASSSGQQLLPALAVSPYLLAASVQGRELTGGAGGSGMQQPASTTLPVASLPSELKLVVEGAIRLYTSTSHRQAQAIVSALYSRSAWYDGPVLLAAGRSSLVGLVGVLRALCARVEVQARPVTVTEPVACGVTSVGEITPSQPAASGVIASAANTAVSKGAPQLPPAVLTLTIPTVQRWHLRPWPARAARMLGLPTTWRLHITTILTLNAATDRVVAHQDVVTDTSTFLPLPSWLRPAVGLPVAVGAALLGL